MKPIFTIHEGEFLGGVQSGRRLRKRIPRKSGKRWDLYLWVYPGTKCYNTRGVGNVDRIAALKSGVSDTNRDFSEWLDAWDLLRSGV